MAARLAKIYGPFGFNPPKRLIPKHVLDEVSIAKELRKFQYKPASKIVLRFDPFHEKVKSIRDFSFYSSAERYRKTNPSCIIKNEICCDRSEPTIKITLAGSNRELLFKTENLTSLELIQLFNKYVSSLYIAEEEVETKVLTKSMSKSMSGGGKGKK